MCRRPPRRCRLTGAELARWQDPNHPLQTRASGSTGLVSVQTKLSNRVPRPNLVPMLRRFALAVLAGVMLVSILPSASSAAVTPKKSMWGPVDVAGVSQFPIYADLGVGIYQTSLAWADVAVS